MAGSARKVLEGPGIHTGAPCRLEFAMRSPGESAADAGPRLLFGGRSFAPAGLATLPRSARRATVLGADAADGAALHTPEHLLVALLFFRRLPVDIRVEGGELPNLDGSALPFREALAALDPAAAASASAPAWEEYPCDIRWEKTWDGGYVRIRPAEGFAVTWTLARGGREETVRLASAAEAWDGILPARTWILHGDWVKGREAGLLRGAGPESGLLLAADTAEHAALRASHPDWRGGPFPLLNAAAWRMDGEAARHKVLDLLGDLALNDLRLPASEIEVRNGGHAQNHLLLERIRHG